MVTYSGTGWQGWKSCSPETCCAFIPPLLQCRDLQTSCIIHSHYALRGADRAKRNRLIKPCAGSQLWQLVHSPADGMLQPGVSGIHYGPEQVVCAGGQLCPCQHSDWLLNYSTRHTLASQHFAVVIQLLESWVKGAISSKNTMCSRYIFAVLRIILTKEKAIGSWMYK